MERARGVEIKKGNFYIKKIQIKYDDAVERFFAAHHFVSCISNNGWFTKKKKINKKFGTNWLRKKSSKFSLDTVLKYCFVFK